MVLGSKESAVKKVMESRDLPGMAGFDHELKTLAARRKRESSQTIQLPSGQCLQSCSVQHTFFASLSQPLLSPLEPECPTHSERFKCALSSSVPLNHFDCPNAGPYTFASYEAWNLPNLTPPPSEATKLLHKLAADPGIADVMKKNSWRVGKLSEMPPEGKEGISPVCILGVNINAGQEISLRLRTDDCKVSHLLETVVCKLCELLSNVCMIFQQAQF